MRHCHVGSATQDRISNYFNFIAITFSLIIHPSGPFLNFLKCRLRFRQTGQFSFQEFSAYFPWRLANICWWIGDLFTLIPRDFSFTFPTSFSPRYKHVPFILSSFSKQRRRLGGYFLSVDHRDQVRAVCRPFHGTSSGNQFVGVPETC